MCLELNTSWLQVRLLIGNIFDSIRTKWEQTNDWPLNIIFNTSCILFEILYWSFWSFILFCHSASILYFPCTDTWCNADFPFSYDRLHYCSNYHHVPVPLCHMRSTSSLFSTFVTTICQQLPHIVTEMSPFSL